MFSCFHKFLRLLRRPSVVVFLLLLSAAAYPLARQLSAIYHCRAARQALQQRDFPTAEAHLNACLAVWTDDEAVHLLAARCARQQEHYAEAQRHLARCRHAAEAPLEGALLRVQRGQLGEAESYLKRTVSPDHPDAALVLEALAQGYRKTDRLMSLLECTDLWLQVKPEDPRALYERGYAWERLRRSEEARDCYERAFAVDPLHDAARLRLGYLLLQRFRLPREAREQFESLRARCGDDPAVLLGLIRCSRLLDQGDEAQRLVEALLARCPDLAEARTERGLLALARGQLSEAESDLRQATTLAPDDREAWYHLVRCLHQRGGHEEEARRCAERLQQVEADLLRLETLIAAIGRQPDDADLRCQAGVLCLRYGKDAEGLHWLESALQASPQHPQTTAALAAYRQRHGTME